MNTETQTHETPLEGQMFLYKQPELLNHEMHGALGLCKPERPFEFASTARVIPLTLPELVNAHMFYPIVFTDFENPVPLAVVGAADDVNLFVDENGLWEPGVYIPAYVRCYPFALATREDEQFAVVIDRAADAVSDTPEQPFFDGEKVTAETQGFIDFCGRYDMERKMTLEFGKLLNELGLLVGHQATRTSRDGEKEVIANYIAVDGSKLPGIGSEKLEEFLKNGYLSSIFAHMFSLENWPRLAQRHNRAAPPEQT